MRRPIRTLRLSIAAVLSLLAFVVVCAAEVNSFWDVHIWQAETGRTVELFGGRIGYQHPDAPRFGPGGHISFKAALITTPKRRIIADAIWGFEIRRFAIHSMLDPSDVDKFFLVAAPLWPFILLLLIAPVRWLIARPANAPAFPVVTDAKRGS